MVSLTLALAAITAFFFSAIHAAPYPLNSALRETSYLWPRQADVIRELGPQLSPNASIFTRDDPRWNNAVSRWRNFAVPDFQVVVEPGVESDVAVAVRYANRRSIPFFAVNRGHGWNLAVGDVRNGIAIRMTTLDGLVPNEDRTAARMQGGIFVDQVMQQLWDIGYVTTTGSCGCVGMVGPALGGGMGRYEGFYGLISDNILSLNVVLADGSEAVVSPTSHPDLWWAMRGAGHNFGIVTSFDIRIYPRTVDAWWYGQYIYSGDRLEQLVAELTELSSGGGGTTRRELMSFGYMTLIPAIDPVNPMLVWNFHYVGTAAQAQPYMAPFLALGPLIVNNGSVPYPQIPDATGSGSASPLCERGLNGFARPVGLASLNATSARAVYDSLRDFVGGNPLYNRTVVMVESYSVEGVRNQDADGSAYPHRGDNIHAGVGVEYAADPALDRAAFEWSIEARRILVEGQPGREVSAYVNYAMGDEPLEEIYGHEPWRLERLRGLKAEYDPENRFRYYMPIIRS